MTDDSSDPWAQLTTEEALRCVQHTVCPRWMAWFVPTTHEGIIWCARRYADGALTHADTPGRLLHHIADADEALYYEQRRGQS